MTNKRKRYRGKKKKDLYDICENDKTNAIVKALASGVKSLFTDPAYKDSKNLKTIKSITSEVTGGKKADKSVFNLTDNNDANALIRATGKMVRSLTKEANASRSKTVGIIKDIFDVKAG